MKTLATIILITAAIALLAGNKPSEDSEGRKKSNHDENLFI
jgi:hypothetical protein